MTQSTPVIPPRPSRSPNKDVPKIPPRPAGRRHERSQSPMVDPYAPSPLNELPDSSSPRIEPYDHSHRPPSVKIPDLGEEGREYEDVGVAENVSEKPSPDLTETRTVGTDLKLHAPRPSLPHSSAKARMQTVTRTDSTQAAAVGLGQPASPGAAEPERQSRSLHSRQNSSQIGSATASLERRKSMHPDDHAAIEKGQKVPMFPSAGDVQAPSPSPYFAEHETSRPGHRHNRTHSHRDHSLPPGSYGLHGHGVNSNDPFEKAWYEKHPDQYVKEEGQFGPGLGTPRPDWAMSSDDLNKIVRSSAMKGSGLGTSPAVTATPEEEVGYIASEELASRLATPAPDSRRVSQQVQGSPAEDVKAPAAETNEGETAYTETKPAHAPSEKTGVIHIDDPYHPSHHPDGFAPAPDPEEQAAAVKEEDGDKDEPILAADEIRPESAFLHPVISPTFVDHHEEKSGTRSAGRSQPVSRPVSRPASQRTVSFDQREGVSTPLEDVEEYEPLFPEDDTKKVVSPAERFRQRPDVLKHKFPSEDIWEDSPNSLQLQATVTTPDIPKPEPPSSKPEVPEQETDKTRQETAKTDTQADDHLAKTSRPDHLKPRFPSRDIWEDAPESQTLVTTIEPSEEENKETKVPEAPPKPSMPSIPPRPQKRPQQQPASAVDSPVKPATSPTEERKPPVIPDRPKPQIPIRPARPAARGSSDGLTKVPSAGSTGSASESKEAPAPAPKPKPPRPVGSKIAALQAGFLSDLNSRLQLGPQGPKPQEKPQDKSQDKSQEDEAPAEKAPLNDARKGRARGPARKRPAAQPTKAQPPSAPSVPEVKLTATWSIWQIDQNGSLIVGDEGRSEQKETVKTPAPDVSLSPNEDRSDKKETTKSPEPIASPSPDEDRSDKTEATKPLAPDVSLSPESTMAPPLAENVAGESTDPKPHVGESTEAKPHAHAHAHAESIPTRPAVESESAPRKPAEPSSPPAADSPRSPSPALTKTLSSTSNKAHEASAPAPAPVPAPVPAQAPAVEPSAPTERNAPKVSSPGEQSEILIETQPSPPDSADSEAERAHEAAENVQAFTGRKVSEEEGNVHTVE